MEDDGRFVSRTVRHRVSPFVISLRCRRPPRALGHRYLSGHQDKLQRNRRVVEPRLACLYSHLYVNVSILFLTTSPQPDRSSGGSSDQ